MSLRDALFQSIANLDRIAPSFEQDAPAAYYSDEKIPLDQTPHASSPYACREDDKFIRLSTSTVNLSPYLRRSKSLPSIRPPTRHAEVDNSKMEAHGEPKITWRHAARIARHLLTVAFSFLSMGVAIAIIGLAADNINWGSGRGSQEANTVTAVVLGTYDADNDFLMRWVTKMSYLPSYYDTPTFSALIVAGAVSVLGGMVAAPLSVLYWKSTDKPVALESQNPRSRRVVLLVSLGLEAFMFLTTFVVLVCVRQLYSQETGYNPYDWTDRYSIRPEYFDPPLPAPSQNTTSSILPMDDVLRYYHSPLHYNPLNWNCRLQGHVSSATQHRLFQLCEEGNAARWLLVVMLLMQVAVLTSHAWAWVGERRGGAIPWASQRLGSEERLAESERE